MHLSEIRKAKRITQSRPVKAGIMWRWYQLKLEHLECSLNFWKKLEDLKFEEIV